MGGCISWAFQIENNWPESNILLKQPRTYLRKNHWPFRTFLRHRKLNPVLFPKQFKMSYTPFIFHLHHAQYVVFELRWLLYLTCDSAKIKIIWHCHCGFIINFLLNTYIILQISHAQTFKMRYTRCPYNSSIQRYS